MATAPGNVRAANLVDGVVVAVVVVGALLFLVVGRSVVDARSSGCDKRGAEDCERRVLFCVFYTFLWTSFMLRRCLL